MKHWSQGLPGAARRWGWLLLLVLGPLYVFIRPATTPVLLAVPALLALLWARVTPDDPSAARRTPLDWAILLLVAMVLVSLWATFSIDFSLPKIAGLVFGVGLFYAVVSRGRARPRALWQMLAVYLALGAGVAALGLLGMQVSTKFPVLAAIVSRLPRGAVSLPGAESGLQPNEVAGVLVWVAPVALALAAAVWLNLGALAPVHGGASTVAAGALLTLVALGTAGVLVLTQSRSGLLGLAAALLVMLLVALWSRRRAIRAAFEPGRRRLWLVGSVVAAAALLVGAGLRYRQPLVASAQQVLVSSGADPTSSDPLQTLDARAEIWSRAIYGIEDFPYTGMGMNTFRKMVNVLYPLFTISPDIDLGHAHNTWLQVALDLGLPGLVAFVALWVGALAMLLQSVRRSATSPGMRALALGLLGALAGNFAFGLTDTVALGARPGFLWWMLVALVTLVWMRSKPAPGPLLAPNNN